MRRLLALRLARPRAALFAARGRPLAGKAAPRAAGAARDVPAACWNCEFVGAPAKFCPGCRTVQPPAEERSFFSLFGLEADRFDVDVAALDAEFRRQQMEVHPDRFASRCRREEGFAAAQSAALNHAHGVIRDPVERARYILKRRGIDLDGGDEGGAGAGGKRPPQTDPATLMEVMELRESMSEASTPEEFEALHADARARLDGALREASEAFRSGDAARMVGVTLRMLYLNSLVKELAQLRPAC